MFHEHRELITELKSKDAHFHKVFDKHNELDESIQQLIAAHADQFEIEAKKKEKLKIKDDVYNMIISYKNSK
jgi:uncharacterized protein YdcH (DUF465 family)